MRKRRKKTKKEKIREVPGFIPYKVAVRLKDAITFSVKLAGRCPDLNIDHNTKTALDMIQLENEQRVKNDKPKLSISDFDIETSEPPLKVLIKQKIDVLGKVIKDNVNRKYKISFFKGLALAIEALILFILMITSLIKANVISIVLLLFIIKYLMSY